MKSEMRDRLEKRLSKLMARTQKIERDLKRPANRDWTERATELENEEVLMRLDEAELAEITEVRAALERLDEGTYGTCQRCQRPIQARRLEVLPFVQTCIDCARGTEP